MDSAMKEIKETATAHMRRNLEAGGNWTCLCEACGHLRSLVSIEKMLEFDFKYDGLGAGTLAFGDHSGLGRGGTGVLEVAGQAVATRKMEHTIPFMLQFDESLDVGSDTQTGVNDADYKPPFKFSGKIHKITLSIDRPKLSPDDVKKLQEKAKEKAIRD
ncbi:MAG TPA: hypothetical protein VKE40_08535 [Gemmataceae bacterium]|nr:hypothetical protein [Gemmataceae bacterium]